MNEVTLPPAPNWYLSSILACANDGTVAWGAKNNIVIARKKDNSKILDYSIIEKAHAERVTTIAFSPKNEQDDNYRLVSGGDDNIVNIWNLKLTSLQTKNTTLDKKHKVIGVDWSKLNSNLICYISEDGVLVTWDIGYNASQIITFGKLTATCLACCPHNENIVAIGSKSGLIYIIDIHGNGTIKYKLRGHDVEIVSLSWCPVPINIFEKEKPKEFMLASGAKDRNIFLWKAGNDGRFETQIPFPTAPLDTSSHKHRVSSASFGNFTAVCWLEPTVLLTSSPWGELLVWNLSGSAKKKFTPTLIHAKHSRGLFSIAGLAQNSIEQIENTENENWRSKLNIKAIWTLSQDRQVICCSLSESETTIEYSIPTQGGFVYCMSACPVDTSQIAFGVGDAMIRLWNLSEPHESVMEVQSLWEKIMGKVRSLSWHPEKENLLAFATNEGRVGVYDTHSKKPPILYRQYHRSIVYRIGWGPAPNVKEYALFSCGDGELVYYNPENFNTNPVSVTKKKNCTEFCWKPDYSILALGFGDGSISFFNRDLLEYGHMIHLLNKAVQCLAWHPESTSSDLNISTMQNYLAVGTISTTISVFDISNSDQTKENVSEKLSLYKTIANLNGHGDKVVCLAWSPHVSGYLVSGSYDYTAQVWKIESQEIIATYTSHLGPLQCCMWSPFNQDLIITGAVDFTLRIWSISNQEILVSPPSIKTSMKNKRTKKKKTKETVDNNVDSVIKSKLVSNGLNVSEKHESSSKVEKTLTNANKTLKKKKKQTHFPGYAEIVNDNKLWISTVKNLLAPLGKNGQSDGLEVYKCNGIEVDKPSKSSEELATIFGNEENLEKALTHEKSVLESYEQHTIVTEIDLWSGNLEENLERASKQNRLNDTLVSLAPSVSMQFWEKMCRAYAQQLIFEENPHRAATYFLCVQDVQRALTVFKTAKLYKEAYVLAVSRLTSDDIEISSILKEWAAYAEYNGHYQNATECYIKLEEYEKAAQILARRKDVDSYILAIDLAKIAENADLITSLADEAIMQSLLNSNVESAKIVLEKCPSIQYRHVEIEVFSELNTLIKNIDNAMIIEWLKGSTETALLETLYDRFPKCSKAYSILLQKDISPIPVSRKMIQLNASHQLALYLLSDEPKKQLQHIVKALHIILQHENSLKVTEDGIPILIKYLCTLGSIKSDSNSIFNSNEFNISKSLKAYLCYGIINWYLEHKLDPERMSQCTDLVLAILETYVEDLLDKDSIKYWTTTNEITKLETLLSSDPQQSETVEDNPVANRKKSTERLDQLRNDKKQFIDERVSSPNPLFSYGAVMEFISKISNDEAQKKISEHVTNIWRAAIA